MADERTTSETPPVEDAADEAAPTADEQEAALWDEVADQYGEETENDSEPGASTDPKESVSGETEESKVSDEKKPEEKADPDVEKPDPLKELSARYEALEQELRELREAAKKAPEVKQEAAVVAEELSEDEKILLESAPGLDKIIDRRAEKIAQALLHKIEKERTETVSKETTAVQEREFWGELQTWAKSKNPDLDLAHIRQSPDFNDWLDSHKSWADSQMAKAKGRRDTSGAKAVFERFFKETQLETNQTSSGSDKKLVSARTPSSASLRSTPRASDESGDLWDRTVDELTKKESKRRYL